MIFGGNMKKKLRVGIAYDVKEDYSISAEGFSHVDRNQNDKGNS